MIKFYGYKKCSTCRKAEKALNELGYDVDYIDITTNPPSATAIKRMSKQAERPITKCFNTSGQQYRQLQLKDKLPKLSAQEQIKLLASDGRLLKRPIVTDGVNTTIGYQEEQFANVWS